MAVAEAEWASIDLDSEEENCLLSEEEEICLDSEVATCLDEDEDCICCCEDDEEATTCWDVWEEDIEAELCRVSEDEKAFFCEEDATTEEEADAFIADALLLTAVLVEDSPPSIKLNMLALRDLASTICEDASWDDR